MRLANMGKNRGLAFPITAFTFVLSRRFVVFMAFSKVSSAGCLLKLIVVKAKPAKIYCNCSRLALIR